MELPPESSTFIQITPASNNLSPAELTALRHVESEQNLRQGLKRTLITETPEEATEELQKLYANLRRQLEVPRIERLAGRCLAEWDAAEQAVRVIRKDGKFGNFGYSRNGQHYLEYFEAMFLLELGRLQLDYHSIIMSVEQAYLLLLGEGSSSKFNEYLVYSSLSRVGYILVRHQPKLDFKKTSELTTPTQVDCIWALLQNELQHIATPDYIQNSPFYDEVKTTMQAIKSKIAQPQQEEAAQLAKIENDVTVTFDKKIQPISRKRKFNEQPNDYLKQCKRICQQQQQSSFVDFLKTEPEFQQFQHIFEKFDIVKLSTAIEIDDVEEEDSNCRDLKISFDLHLHNDGFKKSAPTKLPAFCLLVLDTNATFPTHAEIVQCHRQQQHPVPLLVISVSESKQLQAFMYYFT